ncbi:uncharacterized protein RAG0_08238 [Rhynchosporium agropyri]|uniref:Major facilitator superfamily (MFS) profile domain-containing protein n=1 Tax=Rhynchosporium agropyri TaxID=914238 RepID=A0A1E1KQ08_9HELO|nr:uncharacterized protein RAG0_08238 [Rhynchosporium agropyri]
MAPNDRTPLLAKPSKDRPPSIEEQNVKDARADTSGGFELWQIAALFVELVRPTGKSFWEELLKASIAPTSKGHSQKEKSEDNLCRQIDIAAPSEVAVLRSYVNIASTVGLSSGGPLGGFLAGQIGWRWSFLGQVPIALGFCIFLSRSLRSSLNITRQHEDRNVEGEGHSKADLQTFDYPGAIALAILVTSLLAVIDLQSQLSWAHPLTLSITIAGVLALSAFLTLELYPGKRELLIPLRLLKTEVGIFCLGQLLVIGGCHGFISQIAAYFSNTQGTSDMQGGFDTVPSSAGNAIGSLIAGQIIRRSGCYKKLCIISIACCIVTELFILFRWSHPIELLDQAGKPATQADPDVGMWESLITFPFGMFGGIILSTQFIGLYHCTAKHQMSTAITTYYMSQQIGIALGISLVSAFLKQEFHTNLQKTLVLVPNYQEVSPNPFYCFGQRAKSDNSFADY